MEAETAGPAAEAGASGAHSSLPGGPCPVCASPYVAYVRDVPTIRTKRMLALYTCLHCQSFWNPSGYREQEQQLEVGREWGISVADRNRTAATRLFRRLSEEGIEPTSVAEIGCGIGTLLTVAREAGMASVGFDVNHRAIDYARSEHQLDVHAQTWTADTPTIPIDVYICISVLEHLAEPRPLIENLCRAARASGAALFISVPIVNEDQWHYLLDPDPSAEGTPFFDNDVHVTHFSTRGLIAAMEEFGLEGARPMASWLWSGALWCGRFGAGPDESGE